MIAKKMDVLHDTSYTHLYNSVYLPYYSGDRVIVSPTSGPLRDLYSYQLNKYHNGDPLHTKDYWRKEAEKTLRLLYFKQESKQFDQTYAKKISDGFQDKKFIKAWKGEIARKLPYPIEQLYLHFKFGNQSRETINALHAVITEFLSEDQYGDTNDALGALAVIVNALFYLTLPDKFYELCIPHHELVVLRRNGK